MSIITDLFAKFQATGTQLAGLFEDVKSRLTNAESTLAQHDQAITTLQTANPLLISLVSETVTLQPSVNRTWDLAVALGARVGQYNMANAMFVVKVQNTDDGSATENSWINAEAVCVTGMLANQTTAFIRNQHKEAVTVNVQIIVFKN